MAPADRAAAQTIEREESTAAAQGRQMGGIGITVYDDPNSRGRNASFRTAIVNLQRSGMNDRISSLEVAPGELWEACEHDNAGPRACACPPGRFGKCAATATTATACR